jgi:hypothetical protein
MDNLAVRYPGNTAIRQFHAQGYFYLGDFLHDEGRSREALGAYRMASRMYENLAASDPRNVLTGRFLAQSYRGTGMALIDLGRAIEGARSFYTGQSSVNCSLADQTLSARR